MSRRLAAIICVLVCSVALPAMARTRSSSLSPTITSVSPKRLGIGDTLTIRGRGFVPGARRNTVIFQRDRARPVFIKADQATSKTLRIKLPLKLLPFLSQRGDHAIITRFRLRVLGRRLGRAFTPKALSPLVGPPGTTPSGPTGPPPPQPSCDASNANGDADNDGLSNGLEKQIKTNPCNPDSDGDGVEDGFEYYSALDLNSRALPYPAKRPYPNALFSDADVDYDGDGLTQMEEYTLWVRYGGHRFPLNYSDGNQYTGGQPPVPAGADYLDQDGNGVLSDDEKDADGDGIGNWDEIHGAFEQGNVKNMGYFPGLDYVDADTDGDGVLDGADDQDHDGVTNVDELQPPTPPASGYAVQGRIKPLSSNPLDPCDPSTASRTCPRHTSG